MDTPKIPITDAFRLHRIFTKNNWFSKQGQEDVHESFINLLGNLTDSQKELIFELTERYLWITLNEYGPLLSKTLELVEDEKLINCKRIVLFPIVKLSDIGKIKSSSPLLYQFKSAYFGGDKFKHITFQVIESYKKFEKELFTPGDLLFLVDDFVGSGDTLKETLIEIQKNSSVKPEIINVITLVTQSDIISELEEKNICYYTSSKRNKGITNNYSSPVLDSKIQAMKEIESLMPKNPRYAFGYQRSEALVTMNRTPNNTFPIFWRNHKKGGKDFKAPFPR
jgi:hypothetical protein